MDFPSTDALRFLIFNIEQYSLTTAAFEADPEQVLCFYSKFHGQFFDDFLAVTVHYHGNGVLGTNAALHGIKQLILTDTRSSGFVLYIGCWVLCLDHREGVCSTGLANK